MTKLISIHPITPQVRLLRQVIEVVEAGGVIVYPTDSAYALGCQIGNKHALDRIRQIRQLDERHNFTLMCRDLSHISQYALVDNIAYRFLKAHTPGPYTFILPATKEVPRRLQHPKRKTIGIRVPDNKITQALLKETPEPLMSTTLILATDDLPLVDMDEILEKLDRRVDLIVDGGNCGYQATTVVDLTEGTPRVLRDGKGTVLSLK